jgi:GTP cyclohydrolase II
MKMQLKASVIRREVNIPLDYGIARVSTFEGLSDKGEHIALRFAQKNDSDVPLVRIHSECLTGDVFQSARCDCGDQLAEAMKKFRETGGVLLYLRQEGRGIGLYSKLDAYALQDKGYDTYQANTQLGLGEDDREYVVAAQMLNALGIEKVRLLTNNPKKVDQLRELGIDVVEQVTTGIYLKEANRHYLRAKALHTHHKLGEPDFWNFLPRES